MFGTAATAAQSVRGEIETLVRAQAERILNDLDVVQREEFDAVAEMARLAREENEQLKSRIAALEAVVADLPAAPAAAEESSTSISPVK